MPGKPWDEGGACCPVAPARQAGCRWLLLPLRGTTCTAAQGPGGSVSHAYHPLPLPASPSPHHLNTHAAGFKGTGALEGRRAVARCATGEVIKEISMSYFGRTRFGCKAPASYRCGAVSPHAYVGCGWGVAAVPALAAAASAALRAGATPRVLSPAAAAAAGSWPPSAWASRRAPSRPATGCSGAIPAPPCKCASTSPSDTSEAGRGRLHACLLAFPPACASAAAERGIEAEWLQTTKMRHPDPSDRGSAAGCNATPGCVACASSTRSAPTWVHRPHALSATPFPDAGASRCKSPCPSQHPSLCPSQHPSPCPSLNPSLRPSLNPAAAAAAALATCPQAPRPACCGARQASGGAPTAASPI